MTLADHVRTLGRGPGRARSLTQAEAADAMHRMLSGEAAPEAVGAVLMLLRMKGETAEEIAGFAQAAQSAALDLPRVDLDWPCYSAGRTRGLPWFLLAARLVARAGHRVLLHGWSADAGKLRDHLPAAGIPLVRTAEETQAALDAGGIAFLPLEDLQPDLLRLLRLRDVLGLRSCVNTVARMLNPTRAPASVQGVFHPSYRALQAEAARRLGWEALTVIKGGGGEFERHPAKAVTAYGLRYGAPTAQTHPPRFDAAMRLVDGPCLASDLATLWTGVVADPFAEAVVVGTAALALSTLGIPSPEHAADRLWRARRTTDTLCTETAA